MPTNRVKLEPNQEARFQKWYGEHAARLGINPNPDDPKHKYDYRAAFQNNSGPGADGHWDSRYKDDDHPRRFVDGMDTKTGKQVE
jgi:hypothetical protein